MALEQQVGARLVLGFDGTEATDELIAGLRSLQAQNLIVFERNFISSGQFTCLIKRLEEGLGRRLFVMVDHEGGRVIRFKNGVTRFPDALTVSRTKEPSGVEEQGKIEAQELRKLFVHMNLAPCADVITEGSDPVIGDRSYGSDVARVSALAVARILGLQAHGVAACVKHFPGLGAVQRDPHKVLPTISLSWDDMKASHLIPFQDAIKADVAAIMSSHVCFPNLGDTAGLPATFSSNLIKCLLRDRMNFSGVTLTDDLEMGALMSFGSFGDSAVRATEAGHDMLLICSDLTKSKEAVSALLSAYSSGRLSKKELEKSIERIQRLRKNFLS